MTITFLIPEPVSGTRDETAPAVCDMGSEEFGDYRAAFPIILIEDQIA